MGACPSPLALTTFAPIAELGLEVLVYCSKCYATRRITPSPRRSATASSSALGSSAGDAVRRASRLFSRPSDWSPVAPSAYLHVRAMPVPSSNRTGRSLTRMSVTDLHLIQPLRSR